MLSFFQQFLENLRITTWPEGVAVLAGIVSVWFSKKENILVYPIGLINTLFYVYISAKAHLPGEAAVNLYYTFMSIYGWYWWWKRDKQNSRVLQVSYSSKTLWYSQLRFFVVAYGVIYFALVFLKQHFFGGAIPWADALASASAFTGMWLMTRKKVESWYWWIITNIASMPLYYIKGLTLSSVYYFILLLLAIAGLMAWRRKANHTVTSLA